MNYQSDNILSVHHSSHRSGSAARYALVHPRISYMRMLERAGRGLQP